MEREKNNTPGQSDGNAAGRTHNNEPIAEGKAQRQNNNDSADISAVDQQEGNLNHGELGGNLRDTKIDE